MLKKFTLAMLLTGIGTFSTNAAFADGVGWFLQGAAQYGQLDARIEDEDLDFDEAIEAFFAVEAPVIEKSGVNTLRFGVMPPVKATLHDAARAV